MKLAVGELLAVNQGQTNSTACKCLHSQVFSGAPFDAEAALVAAIGWKAMTPYPTLGRKMGSNDIGGNGRLP